MAVSFLDFQFTKYYSSIGTLQPKIHDLSCKKQCIQILSVFHNNIMRIRNPTFNNSVESLSQYRYQESIQASYQYCQKTMVKPLLHPSQILTIFPKDHKSFITIQSIQDQKLHEEAISSSFTNLNNIVQTMVKPCGLKVLSILNIDKDKKFLFCKSKPPKSPLLKELKQTSHECQVSNPLIQIEDFEKNQTLPP